MDKRRRISILRPFHASADSLNSPCRLSGTAARFRRASCPRRRRHSRDPEETFSGHRAPLPLLTRLQAAWRGMETSKLLLDGLGDGQGFCVGAL
jgi:hypothetical protein